MLSVNMLNVAFHLLLFSIFVVLSVVAMCRYAECRYAECQGTSGLTPKNLILGLKGRSVTNTIAHYNNS
jgi:hypothetical protein